jgi:hypothetical protein
VDAVKRVVLLQRELKEARAVGKQSVADIAAPPDHARFINLAYYEMVESRRRNVEIA